LLEEGKGMQALWLSGAGAASLRTTVGVRFQPHAPPSVHTLSRPQEPSVHTLSRQQVCSGALAALALLPSHGAAAEEPGAAAAVTDRVALVFTEQVSAEERREYAMTLGLYGGKAPRAVERFKALATGTLSAPCEDQMEASEAEALARSALTKRSVYRQCLAAEAEPVSYGGSLVWRITGRRIDAGQVRGKYAGRVPPPIPPSEGAGLSHDAAGLVSVRRTGSFDFGLTTAADASADDECDATARRDSSRARPRRGLAGSPQRTVGMSSSAGSSRGETRWRRSRRCRWWRCRGRARGWRRRGRRRAPMAAPTRSARRASRCASCSSPAQSSCDSRVSGPLSCGLARAVKPRSWVFAVTSKKGVCC